MRYYCVTAYTCYCGETLDEYFAIPDNESIESDKWLEECFQVVSTCASEWWDDDSYDDYDGDFDAYLSECGYDVTEITEEEYKSYTKA